MPGLIISAALFIVLLVGLVLRERRFWKRVRPIQKKQEEEIPKLAHVACKRYEQKYGRPPTALEGLQVKQ